MESHTVQETERHVYRPRLMWQGLLIVLVLIAASLLFVLREQADLVAWVVADPIASLFMLVVIPILLWMGVAGFMRDKLIISDAGLEWWQFGQHHKVPWDEVEAFDIHRGRRSQDVTCGIRVKNDFLPLLYYASASPELWHGNLAMLARFSQSAIGQDLAHYAPQLFDEPPGDRFVHPLQARFERDIAGMGKSKQIDPETDRATAREDAHSRLHRSHYEQEDIHRKPI